MKHSHTLMRNKKSTSNPGGFSLPIAAGLLCALFISSSYAADNDTKPLNLHAIFPYQLQASADKHSGEQQAKHQNMLNLKSKTADTKTGDKWLHGYSESNPTIKEESQYLYTGYKWGLSDANKDQSKQHYFKIMGGLHREAVTDERVSLQDLDATPLLIPAYGYQGENVKTEVSLRKGSALQLNFGFIF